MIDRYGMLVIAGLSHLCTAVWAGDSACPQPRHTPAAPDAYTQRHNPLSEARHHVQAGKRLYHDDRAATVACATCHGRRGDGQGPLAAQFDPAPRNFRCAAMLNALSDGQLFWVIRYGSPDTAMPAHPLLSEEQTWELVLYLRQFAR